MDSGGGVSVELWSSAVAITKEFLKNSFLRARVVVKQGNGGAVELATGINAAALMAVEIR